MGVAPFFLVWGICAQIGKLTVTLKHLTCFWQPKACWMQNHEKSSNIQTKWTSNIESTKIELTFFIPFQVISNVNCLTLEVCIYIQPRYKRQKKLKCFFFLMFSGSSFILYGLFNMYLVSKIHQQPKLNQSKVKN